jgi:hypothetical protein
MFKKLTQGRRCKKNTTLAVLRHALGPYEGKGEIFATTVKCSVSWVKKASAGIRAITPKTAHKIACAVGVSENWLMAGDPKAPILSHDNITPFTEQFYHSWRKIKIKPVDQIDSRVTAKCITDLLHSVFAGVEKGQKNTAVNDLWKFSKIMKDRYGVPGDARLATLFYCEVYDWVKNNNGNAI